METTNEPIEKTVGYSVERVLRIFSGAVVTIDEDFISGAVVKRV